MLRIWGRMSSINVRKVVLCAQVLGLPFERVDAGMAFGVVNSPAYRAKNANGLIPVLEDEDYVLWESNVIVRYLCAREGSALYPESLQQRFNAERWMDWQQTTLNPAGGPAFLQWIRTPEVSRRPEVIAASVAATEPLMALLDEHLSRHAFMAGSAPSMADIPIACELHRWRGLPQERPPTPHLDRWYAYWQSLPASAGVLDLPLA